MAEIINEEVVKQIAELAAAGVQRQYQGTNYLTKIVRLAVIDAANKVMDLEILP